MGMFSTINPQKDKIFKLEKQLRVSKDEMSHVQITSDEQRTQISQLRLALDAMTEDKNAISETKAVLTVQISRLFSELTDLRSQAARDKRNKQMAIIRMAAKAENDSKTIDKFKKECFRLIMEKYNIVNVLKSSVTCSENHI